MSVVSPCDLKLHLAMPEIDMYIYKQNLYLKYYKFEGSQNEKKREMSADGCQRKRNPEWVGEAKNEQYTYVS